MIVREKGAERPDRRNLPLWRGPCRTLQPRLPGFIAASFAFYSFPSASRRGTGSPRRLPRFLIKMLEKHKIILFLIDVSMCWRIDPMFTL